MAGPRGYSSYHGRGPIGKILLMILLVLVILAAAAFILLQQYIVYDESGTPHLLLPEKNPTEETTPQTAPEAEAPDVELTIEDATPSQTLAALELPADPALWQAAVAGLTEQEQNAVCVTVKAPGGRLQYASAVPGASLSATAAAASAALPGILAGETHAIARLSCFRDELYSTANLDSAGLKNTGGYIFYDGNNNRWLDPAKPAARQYLCDLAKECAAMGFDEILLTDVSYPTAGKLDKIAYGETVKDQNFKAFLEELRTALSTYAVKLSIELPASAITEGRDSAAGLLLSDLAPLVDRVYVRTTAAEAPALTAAVTAVSPETAFIPEVTEAPGDGQFLLLTQ